MSKNPIINALGASGYILIIAGIFRLVTSVHKDKPDTFFAPVAVLSLFTLSAAVMAYLFFYAPLQLFIDGKKKEAIRLFMQTVGIFGAITVVVWIVILSGY